MQHPYLSDEQIDAAALMQLGALLGQKAEMEMAVHGLASNLTSALNAALAYQYVCKTGQQPGELHIDAAIVQILSKMALDVDMPWELSD